MSKVDNSPIINSTKWKTAEIVHRNSSLPRKRRFSILRFPHCIHMQELSCINQLSSDWCTIAADAGPHDEGARGADGTAKTNRSEGCKTLFPFLFPFQPTSHLLTYFTPHLILLEACSRMSHLCPFSRSSPLPIYCLNLIPQNARWHYSGLPTSI